MKWKSWKDVRRRFVVLWLHGFMGRGARVQVVFKVIDNTIMNLSYPRTDILGTMMLNE